jgi:hypothetical protein
LKRSTSPARVQRVAIGSLRGAPSRVVVATCVLRWLTGWATAKRAGRGERPTPVIGTGVLEVTFGGGRSALETTDCVG